MCGIQPHLYWSTCLYFYLFIRFLIFLITYAWSEPGAWCRFPPELGTQFIKAFHFPGAFVYPTRYSIPSSITLTFEPAVSLNWSSTWSKFMSILNLRHFLTTALSWRGSCHNPLISCKTWDFHNFSETTMHRLNFDYPTQESNISLPKLDSLNLVNTSSYTTPLVPPRSSFELNQCVLDDCYHICILVLFKPQTPTS